MHENTAPKNTQTSNESLKTAYSQTNCKRALPLKNNLKSTLNKMPLSHTQVSIRKILVSVKVMSAILGPEMAAPVLWTPGKMLSFCRKTYVHKIPRFRGGGYFGFGGGGGGGGGGGADFIVMGPGIFLILI